MIELSQRAATQLGDDHIDAGHILLGLLRVGDGMAVQVLVKLGVDLNLVRRQVIGLLPGDRDEDVIGEGSRLGNRAASRRPGVFARIESPDERLAAIERWVGIRPDLGVIYQETAQVRREKEAAIDRQDFEAAAALRDKEKQLLAMRAAQEKEGMGAAAGGMTLAQELGRVSAELERLRAVLREHGIESGDAA